MQQSFNDDLMLEKDTRNFSFSKVQYPNKKNDIKSKRARQEEQPSLSFQESSEEYQIQNYHYFKIFIHLQKTYFQMTL